MPTRSSPGQPRAVRRCLTFVVLIMCPACANSGLNPVQGKVHHDGKPIKGAVVIFHPKGGDISAQRPSAVSGEDGTFTLTTGIKKGAPAGEYVVTITWPAEKKIDLKAGPRSTEQPDPIGQDQLKGRYANASNSKLTATIKSGNNQLEPFELK